MRILFVISYLDKGGAEKVLSNMTLNFPKDWEIDILVNNDKVVDYEYRANILSLGINESNRTSSPWFQFKVLIKRIVALRTLKRNNRYSACISFMDSANIANILSGNRFCKSVLTVHASLKAFSQKKQYRYVVNPLVRVFYNKADIVVAVSEEMRLELIDYFGLKPEKTRTIINGCDISLIEYMANEIIEKEVEKFIRNKKVVLNVGRLTEQKYQWHLIRAFKEVVNNVPDAVLIIAGSGELECELRNLVTELKLGDAVLFLGYVSNIYKYMKNSDLFVMSSGWEGFPVSLAEAICVGLPCITTDFKTGCREILCPEYLESKDKFTQLIEGEYGMVTPLCSGTLYDANTPLEYAEKILADSIIFVLDSDEKKAYYSQQSMINREHLRIEKIMQQWTELLG